MCEPSGLGSEGTASAALKDGLICILEFAIQVLLCRDWLVLTENVACSMQAGFHLGGGEASPPRGLTFSPKMINSPLPPPQDLDPIILKVKKLPPKIEINDWKQQDDWNNSELDFAS